MSLRELCDKILQGRLTILTGEVGSGKTTFLASFISLIKKEFPNTAAGGVLCRAVFEANTKVGYELEQLPGGERYLFALHSTIVEDRQAGSGKDRAPLLRQGEALEGVGPEGLIRIGRWFILRGVLDKAEKAILSAVRGSCDLVVIDEFGELELQGRGFRSAADELACSGKAGILVVRQGILDEVNRLYAGSISTIVPISQGNAPLPSDFGGL